MPRPRRICVPGLPHHVVQRGNDRQATFYLDADYSVYLACLGKAAQQHEVSIHAYVLMTNHVHLLMTPSTADGMSLTMQAIGRRYVMYINKTYGRSGTLWEGRFRSAVIDSDRYCLCCYRYIELNPLRAGLVTDIAAYRWSSFAYNGLARFNQLLTPHVLYDQLGSMRQERADRYRAMVDAGLDDDTLRRIRFGTRKGLPIGCSRFKAEIERRLNQRLGQGHLGRPHKR